MKRVTISELQAHLRAYLAAASAGETVVVCDQEKSVARIEPMGTDGRPELREPAISDPEERAQVRHSIKPVVHLGDTESERVQAIVDDMRADVIIEPTMSIEELRAAFAGWEPIALSGNADPLAILDRLREDRS